MTTQHEDFTTHEAGRGGWSEWIYPDPTSYLIRCCDCGLVHEMQFRAFVENERSGEEFKVVELPLPIRTMFRARRARKERAKR